MFEIVSGYLLGATIWMILFLIGYKSSSRIADWIVDARRKDKR